MTNKSSSGSPKNIWCTSTQLVRAGYSNRSARHQLCVLMTNHETNEFLQGMNGERSERARALTKRVLDELALIGSAIFRIIYRSARTKNVSQTQ